MGGTRVVQTSKNKRKGIKEEMKYLKTWRTETKRSEQLQNNGVWVWTKNKEEGFHKERRIRRWTMERGFSNLFSHTISNILRLFPPC